MTLRILGAVAMLMTVLAGARAEGIVRSAELISRLQAAIDQAVTGDFRIPGVLISISAPNIAFNWSGASGSSELDTTNKLRVEQPFRIASITKVFTAATVFRLVEERRLGLYDSVTRRASAETIAALRRGGYEPDAITIQEMLAHTSGLYDYAMDTSFAAAVLQSSHRRWTRAEQIAFAMDHGKPIGRPGERYGYSDTGYVILGEIIERVTRQSLPQAIRGQLSLNRLGLSSTYFETLEPPPRDSLPLAHQYLGDTDVTAFDPSFDLFGGGGLVSTTGDINRFLRALLQGRIFKHGGTLAAALMTVDALHESGEHLHSNLLTTIPFGRRTCWAHGGFWGSLAIYCPDADLAVSFTLDQAETHNPNALGVLARALARELDQASGL